MIVSGEEIDQKWLDAALGEMQGTFTSAGVGRALVNAGCFDSTWRREFNSASHWFSWEVANRFLQKVKKRGIIVHKNGMWEHLS